MPNSNVPYVITSFEKGSKYMLRRVGGNATDSQMVTVHNAGASARTGDWVLRFLTTGGQTVVRRLIIPTAPSIGVSAAIKVVTEPTSGSMEWFTIADRCDISYLQSDDAIIFRALSLGAWVAEVTLRETNGTIIYGPTWHRRNGSGGVVVTALKTGVVAGTWYLAQVRFIDTSGGTHTYVDLGNTAGTPTGGAEWWIDDLYVCGGSLPLPANPVFGKAAPSVVIRDQMTSGGAYSVVAAVTDLAEPDQDTTYITETSANSAEEYKLAATGLGAANVLGATCWIYGRYSGTAENNPNIRAMISGIFNYASAMTINQVGGINATDVTTTFTFAGGPPALNDVMRIDDELVTVTNVSGSSVTVTRGALSSVKATHADAAPCYFKNEIINTNQGWLLGDNYHSALTLTANLAVGATAVRVTGTIAQVQVGDIIKLYHSSDSATANRERMTVTQVGVTAVDELTVTRATDGTTDSAHTATASILYADYTGTYATIYQNPKAQATITVTELDRLLFGVRNNSGIDTRTSTILLEYATHANVSWDWNVPRDGVKVT